MLNKKNGLALENMQIRRTITFSIVLICLFPILVTSQNENILYAPCGVVDDIAYPIENLARTTIERGFDDFGLFRVNFGGNHLGLDVAFRQQGNPVYAMARGRVTLADTEEWDTEKGVVILEHVFPDGEVYYSLYGHVELYGVQPLPTVGTCVELGDILAAVGDPSMSAPHMHFEIRNLLPDEGGPGYTDGNPLEEGWFHPLDFIHLWQARLTTAFDSYSTYLHVPDVPPVTQDNGTVVIGYDNVLVGIRPPNIELWQVLTSGSLDVLESLSDNRVFAHTRDGQLIVLTDGRYTAVWTLENVEDYTLSGEMVVFALANGDIEAYHVEGQRLWSLGNNGGRVTVLESNRQQSIIGIQGQDETQVLLVDEAGAILSARTYRNTPLVAPANNGDWMLVVDGRLWRQRGDDVQMVANLNLSPGRTATLSVDRAGNSYLYGGDAQTTLVSWSADGATRWRVSYPSISQVLFAPEMTTDNGCILYTLDLEGRLNVFNAGTGELINQMQFYAGGSRTRRPSARVLELNSDLLRIHAGFLTTITLNHRVLGADVLDACVLG